jgi:hypothetical protein
MVVYFKQENNQIRSNKKAALSCFFIKLKDVGLFVDLLSVRCTMNRA